MFSRVILAALWLGFVFAADQADARSRSSGNGVKRAAPAPRSLQRVQQAPAHSKASHSLHVTRHPNRRFHNDARRRLPFVFSAPYVVGGDGVLMPTAFVERGFVPPGEQVVINGRSCFVQPHIVPADGTGEMRTVTVTRCY